jgi:hypothetical protein
MKKLELAKRFARRSKPTVYEAEPVTFRVWVRSPSAATGADFEPELAAGHKVEIEGSAASLRTNARKLLPGPNWARAIDRAIDGDSFVACLSRHPVDKRAGFQPEIRYALDCARPVPLAQILLLPVPFGACRVPHSIEHEWQ